MRSDPTFLGVVRRVTGATLLVELSPEILSENPIVNGRLYKLGQIGSFVRIPLGFLNLFGIVSMVGASEFVIEPDADYPAVLPPGQRWMEVQLVGEAYAAGPFDRGVSVFPTLEDEVHVVTELDLAMIYTSKAVAPLNIGVQSSSENLPATIDVEKLVTRHAAILGSTGSGKSNTVAAILKALSTAGYPSARVVARRPPNRFRKPRSAAKLWSSRKKCAQNSRVVWWQTPLSQSILRSRLIFASFGITSIDKK
jgi:hypothetical protein